MPRCFRFVLIVPPGVVEEGKELDDGRFRIGLFDKPKSVVSDPQEMIYAVNSKPVQPELFSDKPYEFWMDHSFPLQLRNRPCRPRPDLTLSFAHESPKGVHPTITIIFVDSPNVAGE